jgi:hypothetical protein
MTHGDFFSQSNSFLAIILQLPIPKTRLSSIPLLPSPYPGRLASRNPTRLDSTRLDDYSCQLRNFSLYPRCMDHAENTASIVKQAYLLILCLAIDVLLLRVLAPAGMCLPSCCVAMGLYVTLYILAGYKMASKGPSGVELMKQKKLIWEEAFR